MRFRWKLLILLLSTAIIPILVARIYGVHSVRKLGNRLVTQSQEMLVADMERRMDVLVDSYATVLWRGREQLEAVLMLQAREVELALATQNAPHPKDVYFANDFNKGTKVPPDTTPSSMYFRTRPNNMMELLRVSYMAQVFKLAPGVRVDDVEQDIARLSMVTPVYQKLSRRLKDVVWWYVTGLENGLYGVYPAHNAIPRRLDVREQLWYQQAFDHSIPWSDAFVDPETRQIVQAAMMPVKGENGEPVGVTALVIPMSSLLDRRLLFQNIPPHTKTFMCYLHKNPSTNRIGARIFAKEQQTDLKHRSWRAQIESEWLTADKPIEHQALIKDFQAGTGNVRRMSYKGRDSLWAYGPIAGGSFLILITPYEEILQPAIQESRYISSRIDDLISAAGWFGLGVILLVFVLAFTFSRTVTKPINILNEGAKKLAEGQFDTRVDIRSRDEFGEMGHVFNAMGPQLRENYQMRQALDLAMEVQQNLLPKKDPKVDGLDIAGSSIYCEKTGGDYYDFLKRTHKRNTRISVVVGDVSDHGIPSALLMTTVRALLRQRSSEEGAPGDVVSDVNRHLTDDIEESGQFMTLFYSEIDTEQKWIRWVRAGHDPAIVYDPAADAFRVLVGSGVALGVLQDVKYEQSQQTIHPGQIILIGTDGIWEAHNSDGVMFGKEKLKEIIRAHASVPAKEIMTAIIDALRVFRRPLEWEDDITLVVIKVL